jgi:hypothetical protein
LESDSKPAKDGNQTPDAKPSDAVLQCVEHGKPKSDRQQSSTQYESKHPLEYAIFAFLVLTAVFTGIAASYTRKQWITADDAEKRSLRAYVGAGLVSVGKDPPQIGIAIENHGQTPAINVQVFNSWHETPNGEYLPSDFSFPDKEECPDALKSIALLYPKAPPAFSVAATPNCKTPWATVIRALSGASTLYLYGHIDYLDMFRERHTTTFCLTWASGVSSYCPRHNEIDPKK